MRIIAGDLGGRGFDSPSGHRTHPMSDRVRGALFSILGDIEGLSVLDAYAGSGALGFEAVSRGARQVVAIDSDPKAQKTIAKNINTLKLDDKITLFKGYNTAWSNRNQSAKFDIVICDPPYDQLNFKQLDKMARHLKASGVFVLSWPGKLEAPPITGLTMVDQRSYGDAQLAFYQTDLGPDQG